MAAHWNLAHVTLAVSAQLYDKVVAKVALKGVEALVSVVLDPALPDAKWKVRVPDGLVDKHGKPRKEPKKRDRSKAYVGGTKAKPIYYGKGDKAGR